MEYELSFFNFDYKVIRNKIKKLGGKKIHSMVPYKVAYLFLATKTDFSSGFVRVRDENGETTITTKILNTKYPEEYETIVNTSFENTLNILEKAGLQCKIKTMKYREKWVFPGCHEAVFDLWPGLPIVLEIDCTSEKLLHKACEKLDLNINNDFTDSKYDMLFEIPKKISQSFPDLNFNNFKKLLKPYVKKNLSLFNSLNKKYYEAFI